MGKENRMARGPQFPIGFTLPAHAGFGGGSSGSSLDVLLQVGKAVFANADFVLTAIHRLETIVALLGRSGGLHHVSGIIDKLDERVGRTTATTKGYLAFDFGKLGALGGFAAVEKDGAIGLADFALGIAGEFMLRLQWSKPSTTS